LIFGAYSSEPGHRVAFSPTRPHAGIGFVEAHGLAVILSIVLWRASAARSWHLTALSIDVLLGASNLFLWQIFVAADALPIGYVSTALHWIFATLQLFSAVASQEGSRIAGDPDSAISALERGSTT
jgi:hypothetical protein